MIHLMFMLFMLTILFIYGFSLSSQKQKYVFMSFEHTDILRGIAALIIMLQHFAGENGIRYLTPLGGTGVAIFLIISGFGLNESYKKYHIKNNSVKIRRGYWNKKILKVFLPYAVFESIMILIFKWDSITPWTWILDITSIRPMYWYLQIILISYISFYICSINDKFYRYRYGILGVCGILLFLFGYEIRAEQAISFLAGVLISDNKLFFKNIMLKYRFTIMFFLLGIIFLIIKQIPVVRSMQGTYIWSLIQMIMKTSLALGFISITGILSKLCNNVFLIFMGKISYEFYLVHFAALRVLKFSCNDFLLDIMFLLLSIIGAWLFKSIWEKIILLFKTIRKISKLC